MINWRRIGKTTCYGLLIVFFSKSPSLMAQNIPNSNFEHWHQIPNTFGGEDPDKWRSTNEATAGANLKGVQKSTQKVSGQYALKLFPLINSDSTKYSITAIGIGNPPLNFNDYSLQYKKGGVSGFNTNCDSIGGYYYYSPGTSDDSAYADIILKASNGTILRKGELGFSPNTGYNRFSIYLEPSINPNPPPQDSLVIAFFYRSNNTSPNPAGFILIDSLFCIDRSIGLIQKEKGSGWSIDYNSNNSKLTVKTPPKSEFTSFRLKLFNINGSLLSERNFNRSKISQYFNLNNGNYLVVIEVNGTPIEQRIIQNY